MNLLLNISWLILGGFIVVLYHLPGGITRRACCACAYFSFQGAALNSISIPGTATAVHSTKNCV